MGAGAALDQHLPEVITPVVAVAVEAMEMVATAVSAILTLGTSTAAMEGGKTATPQTVMAGKVDILTTVTTPAEEVGQHLDPDQTEGTAMMTTRTQRKL